MGIVPRKFLGHSPGTLPGEDLTLHPRITFPEKTDISAYISAFREFPKDTPPDRFPQMTAERQNCLLYNNISDVLTYTAMHEQESTVQLSAAAK